MQLTFDSPRWQVGLIAAARGAGIALSPLMAQQFALYGEALLRWNHKMNLTAITDPEEIARRHFVDSLVASPLLVRGATLVDIGSGAGFPGLCLKIARPDLQITLLDGTRKRVSFLKFVISRLDLYGIQAQQGRIEDLPRRLEGHFDAAVSRAVAALGQLAAWARPLLAPGGILIAWKGRAYASEIEALAAHGAKGISDASPWRCRAVPYRVSPRLGTRYLIVAQYNP